MQQHTNQTRILVLGAGFGGVYVLKHLHKYFHKDKRVHITVVNPTNYFLFTPLLHEVATGSLSPGNIIEPLRKLFKCCNITYVIGEVKSLSLKNKQVQTTQGEFEFDYAVVALGSQANFYNVKGAEKYSFQLKTLSDAIQLKNHFIHIFEKAAHEKNEEELYKLLHFVVVGGGPTGVELVAEMSELFYDTFGKYYPKQVLDKVRISLLQKEDALLNHFPPSLQKRSLAVLKKKRVHVHFRTEVTEVGADYIKTQEGNKSPTRTVIWTAGVAPQKLVLDEVVETDGKGRLVVDGTLRTKEFKNIFVLGDMAAFKNENGKILPMLAQVATQEGEIVAQNIKRLVNGEDPLPFTYHHSGDLVSLGEWVAVGEIGRFKLRGRFTWWLWRTVYLSKLVSHRKKLKVAFEWTINLFLPRDISEFYNKRK